MSVFLLILKIIGITLLIIIGVVLTVLLLVLFVPIRYKLYAEKKEDEDFKAVAKATWLLSFLTIKAEYCKELYYRVKILFFCIKKSDNLNNKKSEKNNISSENPEPELKEDIISDDYLLEETDIKPYDASHIEIEKNADYHSEYIEENEEPITDNTEKNEDDEPSLIEKLSFAIKKIKDIIRNFDNKINGIVLKIKDIINDTNYYIDAVNDKKNQEAFILIKDKLILVLKDIRPRKIKGFLRYGSEDPESTGKVISIYSILFPVIHDKIQFISEYDREVFEGNLLIKGRITVAVLLYAFVKVYFNKDAKRMIKIFKKE